MMNSSIDDGGLEFRGTEATLKIDRGGFAIYREHVEEKQNPSSGAQLPRRNHRAHGEFLRMHQDAQRAAAPVETGVAAARAGHIGNLAHQHGGQYSWPPEG